MLAKLPKRSSKERVDKIFENYNLFLKELNNTSVPPVNVFYPLNEEVMAQLMLVREASKTLQKKKEEDVHAAEAARQVEATKKPEEAETETQETAA